MEILSKTSGYVPEREKKKNENFHGISVQVAPRYTGNSSLGDQYQDFSTKSDYTTLIFDKVIRWKDTSRPLV